jgi:large subunit ribosomal protein L15
MDLSNLKYSNGSRKDRKRVGRGGSRGKQAGRGHKGQKSRSGATYRVWFEGGQMPIQRRLPKRGFKNIFREEYQIVNLGGLNKVKEEDITPEVLYKLGLIRYPDRPVKILGNGALDKKITVSAHAFSQSAKDKIESAGGRASVL